jgi:hypothetical protein
MSLVAKAAESGHWYTRDGEPAYTTIGANGKRRNTTLRDARTQNLVPSVTTILGVADKPGLRRWLQEQVLLAALTLPKIDSKSDEQFIARIIDDSQEQTRSAADAGTDIHAAIEAFYMGQQYDRHREHVQGAHGVLLSTYGHQPWVAERSFCHELGFGGKVDLHAPGFVVDVKTKEFADPAKIDGYDEHRMQLAAYRELLLQNNGMEVDFVGILHLNAKTRTEGKIGAIQGQGWQLIQQRDTAKELSLFDKVRDLWLEQNKDAKPKKASYTLTHKKA